VKALVTGGGGFLGRAIVERLLARGDEVTSLSRASYPELEALGARTLRADLGDAPAVRAALESLEPDVVFHVAAKAGVFGRRADYFRANVDGTRNVLEACRAGGVERLVYTSSPSVCFDGTSHVMAKGDLPYAKRFLAPYPESKARAEALVLEANGARLSTCALRPHLVFGPRDPHIVPRLVERARAGRLLRVGAGDNLVGITYVDNAAHAHMCAADALAPGAPHAGRAYFITQEEPVRIWDWIEALLCAVGAPPPTRRVSPRTAYAAGALCELAWRALRLPGEPPMTRLVAAQLATSHTYDMAPAREDFGYRQLVSLEEATERLVASLRARSSTPDR